MKSNKDIANFVKEIFKKKKSFLPVLILLISLLLILAFLPKTKESSEGGGTSALSELCSSVDGVGECKLFLIYEKDKNGKDTEKVYSVAVICEGADKITVRSKLTELITSVYGIGANRVSILKMSNTEK